MRVAIYARVSTEDKGQDPENQLRDLRAWCADSGHDLVGEYVDRVSGRKGVAVRKQFAALFEDASKRKFDCVLFWALDRFSREGMVPTIQHLERLNSYGVTFHSYTEPNLCSDNEMVRGILLAMLATMAKQEAKRLSERVRAGIERARKEGKRLGRPTGHGKKVAKVYDKIVAALQAPGRTEGVRMIAKRFGVDPATVQSISKEIGPFEAGATI